MRAALLLMLFGGTALAAPPVRDPNWPCQSVKVPELSLAALWNGPPLDPYLSTWTNDADAAALAQRLAQRRVPLQEAEEDIRQFEAQSGAAKQQKLMDLMAGLFSTMDKERSSVVAGLIRFGRRQKELGGEVRSTMESLRKEQDKPNADQAKVAQLTEHVQWGTRVFGQRQTSVRYACDVPNVIEQRLGALARVIQSALS